MSYTLGVNVCDGWVLVYDPNSGLPELVLIKYKSWNIVYHIASFINSNFLNISFNFRLQRSSDFPSEFVFCISSQGFSEEGLYSSSNISESSHTCFSSVILSSQLGHCTASDSVVSGVESGGGVDDGEVVAGGVGDGGVGDGGVGGGEVGDGGMGGGGTGGSRSRGGVVVGLNSGASYNSVYQSQ